MLCRGSDSFFRTRAGRGYSLGPTFLAMLGPVTLPYADMLMRRGNCGCLWACQSISRRCDDCVARPRRRPSPLLPFWCTDILADGPKRSEPNSDVESPAMQLPAISLMGWSDISAKQKKIWRAGSILATPARRQSILIERTFAGSVVTLAAADEMKGASARAPTHRRQKQ